MCQVELAMLVNVGVRVDSVRAINIPFTGLLLCLRIRTVTLNSPLSLSTHQGCFAATVCPVWRQTASAARLSAGNAEDSVAARAPAVGSVGVVSVSSLAFSDSCLALCYHSPIAKHAVLLVPDLENGERSQALSP